MVDPKYMKCIQIEITNACDRRCCHCSRLIGHHPKPFFMTLDEVENGLQTLIDFPGHVGIMGGEPTLHKDFEEICKLYQKYIPVKACRQLWTNGLNWEKHRDVIEETFYPELISYNEHEEVQPCWHQPLQVGIEEVIKDRWLMFSIIDNCWVQNRWSASITPKGAFFCEVAAARAHLLDSNLGMPVEPGWWKKALWEQPFLAQRLHLCPMCSACLPMPIKPNDDQEWDDISPENMKRLEKIGSPKCKAGKCKLYDIEGLRKFLEGHTFEPETDYWKRGGFKDFPNWTPYNYRPFEEKKHTPQDAREMECIRKNSLTS